MFMKKQQTQNAKEKLSTAKSLILGYSIALRDLPFKNETKLFVTDYLDGFDGLRSMNEIVDEMYEYCKASEEVEDTEMLNEIKKFLSDFKSEYSVTDLYLHMNHITDVY